ncbi:DeoR family transcriptional regulator [Sporanaerobium hydrogeniformans]|uniref:DeoR family transcriptional regulator n=1 Tax=Sporanaerobium hydrogeniformans TaxID=3072179 RepID=A0AC61DE29_9FIRM|nr:DeoR/GlpR family DNA-binding transcription regulator [Sporanaerobium hydrogeniformans]PHV71400.1 DeoR family transcriptional regulator [Sporanaerobium hydrogeniformans]
MGKVEERQSEILEVLSLYEKLEVTELARKCHVSLVTMRKDLSELEKRGLLKREQGFAFLVKEKGIYQRLARHYALKCRLAKKAASLVSDGETIMMEGGSCCILVAEEISRTKKKVTIITNSVFMMDYIGKNPHVNLVLLGGDYLEEAQAVVGPVAKMGARLFHVNKLFTGTDGYLLGNGFTSTDHLVMDTVRNMAESAEQVVVVTESEKFLRRGVVPLFTLGETHCLITDSGIPKEIQKELENSQVKLITIPLNEK